MSKILGSENVLRQTIETNLGQWETTPAKMAEEVAQRLKVKPEAAERLVKDLVEAKGGKALIDTNAEASLKEIEATVGRLVGDAVKRATEQEISPETAKRWAQEAIKKWDGSSELAQLPSTIVQDSLVDLVRSVSAQALPEKVQYEATRLVFKLADKGEWSPGDDPTAIVEKVVAHVLAAAAQDVIENNKKVADNATGAQRPLSQPITGPGKWLETAANVLRENATYKAVVQELKGTEQHLRGLFDGVQTWDVDGVIEHLEGLQKKGLEMQELGEKMLKDAKALLNGPEAKLLGLSQQQIDEANAAIDKGTKLLSDGGELLRKAGEVLAQIEALRPSQLSVNQKEAEQQLEPQRQLIKALEQLTKGKAGNNIADLLRVPYALKDAIVGDKNVLQHLNGYCRQLGGGLLRLLGTIKHDGLQKAMDVLIRLEPELKKNLVQERDVNELFAGIVKQGAPKEWYGLPLSRLVFEIEKYASPVPGRDTSWIAGVLNGMTAEQIKAKLGPPPVEVEKGKRPVVKAANPESVIREEAPGQKVPAEEKPAPAVVAPKLSEEDDKLLWDAFFVVKHWGVPNKWKTEKSSQKLAADVAKEFAKRRPHVDRHALKDLIMNNMDADQIKAALGIATSKT